MRQLIFGFLSTLVLTVSGAHAQTAKIEVADAWARPTIGQSRNGAAYLTVTNRGTEPDRLVAAATPAAGKVELHTTVRDGEVLRMREMPAVDLKPGEAVTFAPGGMHVMLIGVREPLKAGQSFPLTLRFEKAGEQQVTVAVRQGGAPAHGHGAGHGHGGHQK
jgi:copper(I)-binding protein